MGWWSRLRAWWKDPVRHSRARARRELDALFTQHADLLKGTSLRAAHRGRVQVLDAEDAPRRVHFGIVRHPRPYAFSSQSHQVLELWCYHVTERRLERQRGVNLTRVAGEDGDAPLH